MHSLVNTGLHLSSSGDASPVQYLEKQSESFFPGPFSDASFVGNEPSCSFVVRSTQGCHLLYQGGGKKTESSQLVPSPPKTSKPANLPQNPKLIPCLARRGTGALRQNCRKQAPSDSLPLQGRRALATEKERADRKKKDSYTFRRENTFG